MVQRRPIFCRQTTSIATCATAPELKVIARGMPSHKNVFERTKYNKDSAGAKLVLRRRWISAMATGAAGMSRASMHATTENRPFIEGRPSLLPRRLNCLDTGGRVSWVQAVRFKLNTHV